MLGRAGWARLTLLPLAVLVLAGVSSCGTSLPSAHRLVQRSAAVMAGLSCRVSGHARAGSTTITFAVRSLAGGDFSGSLDIEVPRSPTLSSKVVALGQKVYVLSPLSLSQMGITSLPGNLNPDTTWVLQSGATAKRYRDSLAPFVGKGLGATLKSVLTGTATVTSVREDGRAAWLVREGSPGSSLELYIARGSYQMLKLTITGTQAVSLRYSDFGRVPPVVPPPPAQVYSPPTPAPGA